MDKKLGKVAHYGIYDLSKTLYSSIWVQAQIHLLLPLEVSEDSGFPWGSPSISMRKSYLSPQIVVVAMAIAENSGKQNFKSFQLKFSVQSRFAIFLQERTS
jgi:hypothetical protein